MDDLTPSAPEGYALVARIGRGASSLVWEARRPAGGRPVALKILDADLGDADAVRRFEREREAMTALARHRNILTIVDAGVHSGRPWLALELCRRGSLAAYVADGGPLDLPTALRVLHRLADALAVAHDAGIVHCDVKPANVMLTDAGEPALGDFGIARVSVGRATTTTVGGFSLDHVAPELLDDGSRSPRSDVYSLGTTTWELLVGHPPFRQTADVSVGAVLTRILRQPLPEAPAIPDDVLALLRTMAAKTPEERPASMREVGGLVRELAQRLGIDLGERVLPELSAVQLEVLTTFPEGPDLALAAESTHRRLYARPELVSRNSPARSRTRRIPLAATASVVTLVAVGAAAAGVYGMTAAKAPTPAPVARQEVVAPPPAPTPTTPTPPTPTTTETATVEEPPPAPTRKRSTTARRTAPRRTAEAPPPPPPSTTQPPPTTEPPPEPTTVPPSTNPPDSSSPSDDGSGDSDRSDDGALVAPTAAIAGTASVMGPPKGRIIPGTAR